MDKGIKDKMSRGVQGILMYYGTRRLLFVSREQEKQGWQATRHRPNKMKRLRFTVKQWKKFDLDKQMYLTKIFHVTLTDHKTRREKIISILKKFTPENTRKGTAALQKGIDDFSKAVKEINFSDGTKKDYGFLGANDDKKKDYSFLVGKN